MFLFPGVVRLPHRCVWIVADGGGCVVGGHAGGQQGRGEVVERGLAALLVPRRGADLLWRGQPVALHQPTNVLVVPDLVGRLEQGRDNAVGNAQDDEDDQDRHDRPVSLDVRLPQISDSRKRRHPERSSGFLFGRNVVEGGRRGSCQTASFDSVPPNTGRDSAQDASLFSYQRSAVIVLLDGSHRAFFAGMSAAFGPAKLTRNGTQVRLIELICTVVWLRIVIISPISSISVPF